MPSPVRRSGRNGGNRTIVAIGSIYADIADGKVDLSEWTDEQIENCRKSLRGRPPALVPYQLVQEFQKRTREKAQQRLHDMVNPALDALSAIINGADVEPKDQLAAVKMVLERSLGREPVVVEAKVETTIETVARGMVVDDRSGFDDEPDDGSGS